MHTDLKSRDAITIKGFDPAVTGYSRGEGAFIITPRTQTVLVSNIMQKLRLVQAVVQELIHQHTQLRKAGFYTGASIGTPSFSVSRPSVPSGTVRSALTVSYWRRCSTLHCYSWSGS